MSAYFKVIFRSIRQSLGRFLAILLITALGVGFFTGLKVSMPSFIKTGNEYIKDNQMYDIRLISTIGFDEEDIDKLSKTDNVRACEGALFKDAEVRFADKEDYFVLRLHSFMENINMFVLEEGRLPQSGDEIVVDGYNCDASWVGKTLVVRDQDGLNYAEYKVVGTGRSPYYLNFQRGTSDVGNGSVSIYAYADKSAFDYEYYTEAYVKLDSDLYMYSDEYEDLAETEVDRIKTVADIIEYDRFMELKGDAINDYEDGLTEYYDSLKDAQKELTDGVKELEDARVELIDADKELADAKIELDDAQKEISDGESKLATAGDQIEDGRKQLEEGKKTLDDSYSVASDLKKLEKKHAVKRLTPSTEVFVAHYDARQFNYYQYSDRGETLDLSEVPAVAAFNEYYGGGMNSIVFQEMRESKALAYSAMAGLNSPSWKDDTYSFFAYIASQNDKLQKAVEGFDEIIENMPVAPENLEIAKSSILSKIRTQRVIGAGVLSSYLNAKELGIKEPLDKLIFEKVDGMTMDDMVATHAKWVKDRTYVYGILGDTKDLDMAFLKTLGPVKILSLEDIFGY